MVCRTLGVPVMPPLLGLYVKPVGSAGLNAQLVTVPPLTLGMLAAIATPLVRVMFSGEKLRPDGATSLTVMFRLAEVDPPELLAQTV